MATSTPSPVDERAIFRLRKAAGGDGQFTWQLRQDPDLWCGEWATLRLALDEAVSRATAVAPARLIVYDEDGIEVASRDFDLE